jgi:hypothetical protein
VRAAAMHGAAIVPDHEIPDLPSVAVGKFGPGGMQLRS